MAKNAEDVFRSTGLTKVYRSGAQEVHALRGVASLRVLGFRQVMPSSCTRAIG